MIRTCTTHSQPKDGITFHRGVGTVRRLLLCSAPLSSCVAAHRLSNLFLESKLACFLSMLILEEVGAMSSPIGRGLT